MGSEADKLNYLKGTKEAIANAISSKGVVVPANATFRSYADLIGTIQSSDGGGGSGGGGDGGGSGGGGTDGYTLQMKSVVPTGTDITVLPDDGYYGLLSVAVSGDENLTPENIAEGVSIYGVEGALASGSGGSGSIIEKEELTCEAVEAISAGQTCSVTTISSDGFALDIPGTGGIEQPVGAIKYAEYSKDGTLFVVLTDSVPYIFIYDTTTNPWTKIQVPSTPPPLVPSDGSFSFNGNYFAISFNAAPWLLVYSITSTPWTVTYMGSDDLIDTTNEHEDGAPITDFSRSKINFYANDMLLDYRILFGSATYGRYVVIDTTGIEWTPVQEPTAINISWYNYKTDNTMILANNGTVSYCIASGNISKYEYSNTARIYSGKLTNFTDITQLGSGEGSVFTLTHDERFIFTYSNYNVYMIDLNNPDTGTNAVKLGISWDHAVPVTSLSASVDGTLLNISQGRYTDKFAQSYNTTTSPVSLFAEEGDLPYGTHLYSPNGNNLIILQDAADASNRISIYYIPNDGAPYKVSPANAISSTRLKYGYAKANIAAGETGPVGILF